ncbi:MBL fold metallo-hydrolase [Clostridium sp. E02]|uniref:MBL fold metallo-hydrolase n=1 Tax=Clostridium sp. E02 TaxID=2487134 RepID=UPI000F542C48|nr:MBL fold metallo-hydrolase [Clostridium sp. E02]
MAEIKRIRCGAENTYLVENQGRAILVDTGRKGFEELILAQCRKTKVELIVLTHGHIEQVQNAAFLSEKLKVPLALHPVELDRIKNDSEEPLLYQGILGLVFAEITVKKQEIAEIPDFRPDIFLKEGDCLTDYGLDARVMELPGHTRGSIGLDIEESDLIVGDALMNLFYPGLPMVYSDRESALKSAEKIHSLGSRKLYFSHGDPVDSQTFRWSEN